MVLVDRISPLMMADAFNHHQVIKLRGHRFDANVPLKKCRNIQCDSHATSHSIVCPTQKRNTCSNNIKWIQIIKPAGSLSDQTPKKTDTPRRNMCNYDIHWNASCVSISRCPTYKFGHSTKFQAWKFSKGKGLPRKTLKKVGTFSGATQKGGPSVVLHSFKRFEEHPKFPAKYDISRHSTGTFKCVCVCVSSVCVFFRSTFSTSKMYTHVHPICGVFLAPGILLKPRVAAKRIAGVLSWKSQSISSFPDIERIKSTPTKNHQSKGISMDSFCIKNKNHPTTPAPPFLSSRKGCLFQQKLCVDRAPWPDPIVPWWPRPESTATPVSKKQHWNLEEFTGFHPCLVAF